MHSWQGRQRNCERHSVCHKNIWTQQLPQRSKLGTDAILLYHLNPLKHLKIKVSQDIESTTMAPEEVAAEEEDLDRPQTSRRRKLPPRPQCPQRPRPLPRLPWPPPRPARRRCPRPRGPGCDWGRRHCGCWGGWGTPSNWCRHSRHSRCRRSRCRRSRRLDRLRPWRPWNGRGRGKGCCRPLQLHPMLAITRETQVLGKTE